MQHCRYEQEFGFTIPGRSIIVDDIRVRGKGKAGYLNRSELPLAKEPPIPLEVGMSLYILIYICNV